MGMLTESKLEKGINKLWKERMELWYELDSIDNRMFYGFLYVLPAVFVLLMLTVFLIHHPLKFDLVYSVIMIATSVYLGVFGTNFVLAILDRIETKKEIENIEKQIDILEFLRDLVDNKKNRGRRSNGQ